jgi:lysozyme
MAITQLDQAGLTLITQFEGCVLHPYLDQVGIPTIGIGMTYYPGTGAAVTMQDPPITQQQADDYFIQIAQPYASIVHFATVPVLNQNQFNALFSFCYNIGIGGFKSSTVLRLVNQNITDNTLLNAFLMWDKAGGNVLQALVKRRTKEYQVYIS